MRVSSVKHIELAEPVKVYDLTNNIDHNFALANGVVVHNSVVPSRYDIKTQEVLALKGKPINAARVTTDRYSANVEVFNILVAMGYNPAAKDPYKELRVLNKVIFLADADDDGAHITLLLLVLFARVMPKLIEQGRVFIADAPLFNCEYKGVKYYGNTRKELLAQLPKGANPAVQRLKGWGEASQAQMRHIAMDPASRKLIKVTMKNVEEISNFLDFMGHNGGDDRKELLGIEVGV